MNHIKWVLSTLAMSVFIFPQGAFSAERKTPTAPDEYLLMTNPIAPTEEVLKDAESLYKSKCRKCHSSDGKGRGTATKGMKVKPRDYTDKAVMEELPDGQLFWIIVNGSDPDTTEMEGFKGKLKEEDAWKLVLYIRNFAK